MNSQDIIRLLAEAGACAAGVCRAAPVASGEKERLLRWLTRGCNGTMDYLRRNSAAAFNTEALLEGTHSIICAAFNYMPAGPDDRNALFADYARGADYHKALKKRLKPVARFLEEQVPGSRTRICVDTAPVRERYWAVAAGLGHCGRNGLLIVPGIGSKVFLAEILWTEAVEGAAEPDSEQVPEVGCVDCGACVRACPAGALDGLGGLDARKCLSYLTIEYGGELPSGLRLPGRIYGCDICQDVCPENRVERREPLPEFQQHPAVEALTRTRLQSLDQQEYDSIFAGSAVKRAPLERLKRNSE